MCLHIITKKYKKPLKKIYKGYKVFRIDCYFQSISSEYFYYKYELNQWYENYTSSGEGKFIKPIQAEIYKSGFHIFPKLANAINWLTDIKEHKRIYKVQYTRVTAKGRQRNREEVHVAQEMKITQKVPEYIYRG